MKKRVTKKMKDIAMEKIQKPEPITKEGIEEKIDEMLANAWITQRTILTRNIVQYILDLLKRNDLSKVQGK